MKEADLRRWHRTMGIIVAAFIILQAGSGFVLSLGGLPIASTHAHEEAYNTGHAHEEGQLLWQDALVYIHLGGGIIGTIYRLLLGLGIVVVAVSGSMIFFKARARSKRR
jgi:uncharacterized iron-regulated membrane protein